MKSKCIVCHVESEFIKHKEHPVYTCQNCNSNFWESLEAKQEFEEIEKIVYENKLKKANKSIIH